MLMHSLQLILNYLRKVNLNVTVFKKGNFKMLGGFKDNLELDHSVIESLDIFTV